MIGSMPGFTAENEDHCMSVPSDRVKKALA
jgi:hypothetical protein